MLPGEIWWSKVINSPSFAVSEVDEISAYLV